MEQDATLTIMLPISIEINRVHEVEGQKDPNMFAPLR